MLYTLFAFLYMYLKPPASAPTNPSGTAPLHRHTMSASLPVTSASTVGGVIPNQSSSNSPVTISRDVNGLFSDDDCFFCGKYRTHHRCTALFPNGYFTLDLQRVCGRYFCHECSQQWDRSATRARCLNHIDIAEGQAAPAIQFEDISSDDSESDLYDPPF